MDWEIRIYKDAVDFSTVAQMAGENFDDYVKGVVDIEGKLLGLGGELHSDIGEVLRSQGGIQPNLWGINLYPNESWPEMIEFDSLINIRPRQSNRTRYVEDPLLREKILKLVGEILQR